MKLLHILATPRDQASTTLKMSNTFIHGMQKKYPNMAVETLDLFNYDLPAVAGDNIEAKYRLMQGLKIDKRSAESWQQIEMLIEHFLSADIYVITAPMWNFSIPYALKYYIDCIVQPGYLFQYSEMGPPVGMVKNKRMICITSRGSDYSKSSPAHSYDFQEPYLRAIFGFCGITDISFVNAEPMDISPELRELAIQQALSEIKDLVKQNTWETAKA